MGKFRQVKGIAALAVALCMVLSGPVLVHAGSEEDGPPAISAPSYLLMEPVTGKVLLESNADEARSPASITKVMTLLLTMEALDEGRIQEEDMVTATEHACSMNGSQIWLEPGEKMAVRDLIKAVAVGSANDAAVALAEHLGGSEEAFVELMNQRAKQLGMENTVFHNASGLDEEGHVSTARDIAIMSCQLLSHEKIKEYSTIWMDELRAGKTQLVNTNRLVRFYKGATGLKTGTTDTAGCCLSASASRGELSLVAVVLGCKTDDDRFADARSLLDYGFANFTFTAPPECSQELGEIQVLDGVSQSVGVVPNPPAGVLVEKGTEKSLESEVELMESVQAPVQQGQQLGTVTLTLSGETVCTYPILAETSVEKMTIWTAMGFFFRQLIQL